MPTFVMDANTVFWTFVAAMFLGPMLANHWYRLRVKQWEMSLKHAMIERGMSAAEIKLVLETTAKDKAAKDLPGKSCCSTKEA